MPPVLQVSDLAVRFHTQDGVVHAVNGVSFDVNEGETLAIVGESGCGKSVTMMSLLRLASGRIASGTALFHDGYSQCDLLKLSEPELRQMRGGRIGFIFQDPLSSLNPVLTIGTQLVETLRAHLEIDGTGARVRARDLLSAVGIPEPQRRLAQFPHELSGGMRQRVAIAIALSCEPRLLIADEPTTALDVTVQAQILDLLAREQRRSAMAMVLITHDLGVVAGRTDEVAVMYAGRVVEQAPTRSLFRSTRSPYTAALLGAIPKIDAPPHTLLAAIPGRPPDLARLPDGCAFAPRCPSATARCAADRPPLAAIADAAHAVACWQPLQPDPGGGVR